MIKILFSTGQFLVNACKQDWYSLILQLGKKICKWTGIPVQRAKIRIIYQLANLPISRKIFSLHLPFTSDIGTIQEERTMSEKISKNK